MARGKGSEEQLIGILNQVEVDHPVVEACRENGAGESAYYKWKSNDICLKVNEARQLRIKVPSPATS